MYFTKNEVRKTTLSWKILREEQKLFSKENLPQLVEYISRNVFKIRFDNIRSVFLFLSSSKKFSSVDKKLLHKIRGSENNSFQENFTKQKYRKKLFTQSLVLLFT
eukprot:UN05471